MNLRKAAYFWLLRLRGQALGSTYERFLQEDQEGIPPDTTRRSLVQLLSHSQRRVPYYAQAMRGLDDSYQDDPEAYLSHLPILTKDTIHARFDGLKSDDLARRHWYINSSGGSTGAPVQIIQDWSYATKAGAVTMLYSKLAGKEIGELELRLWGSLRDIVEGGEGWKARFMNRLANTEMLNAFQMSPASMREFIAALNARRPRLILAYVEAIYELARFAEREGLKVLPQAAIMTSAGTLYPFMRELIEKVFQCRVFNRYGCREVGDIACERPDCSGLWVAPWGNYIEIVDGNGKRVPDGTEGEILVTSLTNFAMPLIRYRIGDRGVLSPVRNAEGAVYGQRLESVLGRTVDLFTLKNGNHIYGLGFVGFLRSKDWVVKTQVVQTSHSSIVFRIVQSGSGNRQAELDEVAAKTRLLMGDDCQVAFEFVDDIPASGSGKYRYVISEVQPDQEGEVPYE